MCDLSASVRTQEVQDSLTEFRDAVEELARTADELESSALYIEDPISGNMQRIEVSEFLDVEISISGNTIVNHE